MLHRRHPCARAARAGLAQPGRWLGLGLAPLLAAICIPFAAGAAPRAKPRAAEQTASSAPLAAPTPPADPMRRIGSISVGHPAAGFLINGLRMPSGEAWVVSAPDWAWGTDETIDALIHCLRRVHELHPGGPRAIVGAISQRDGGPFPPHQSHRTGRDVDVHLYLTHRKPKTWYEPATAENLDRVRSWALLRTLITEADIELVLLDRSVQALLEEHALSIGEPPQWISELFHDGPSSRALVRHVPGHSGHLHVRFVSPIARRRGRELYDRLVEQGHVEPPSRELIHEVQPGDTLLRLKERYGSSVEELQRINELDSPTIKLGQRLRVRQRVDIRGARDAVVVPGRRLPPDAPLASAGATPQASTAIAAQAAIDPE